MSVYQKDEERLKRLATGDNREWKLWYDDMRSPFRAFFMRHSAVSPEEAVSLYHETMVVFHRNVTTGKLTPPLQSALRTYLFGIGKLVFKKAIPVRTTGMTTFPTCPSCPKWRTGLNRKRKLPLSEACWNASAIHAGKF